MKSIKILSVMIVFSISIFAGEWTLTGSLNQARKEHCAILLSDGQILVAGGWSVQNGDVLSLCEIYNPKTGQWTYTDSMQYKREHFAMVELENGKILAIGGFNFEKRLLNSCEIYDPITETWTQAAPLNAARDYHQAILLPNGLVLVVGGIDDISGDNSNKSCEIYDLETDQWFYTNFLNEKRESEFTLTLLHNGNVLVTSSLVITGGQKTCEIYNLQTSQWEYTGSLNTGRCKHTTTLLPNGKILITGGQYTGNLNYFLNSSEIYDPETREWSETDSLEIGRCVHTTTLLPNGKVLVNGGWTPDPSPNPVFYSTEIYNPETGLWQTDADMSVAKYNHTSTLLLDGRVLAACGGWTGGTELYSWNHQPSVSQFQCLENSFVGDTLNIRVNVTDPDNDSVSVRFICSPGDTSEWSEFLPSGCVFEKSHCYDSGGIYQLQVQVRDIWHCQGIHNSLSDWISGPEVHIRDLSLNQPPQINQPQGPSQGFVNDTLTFNVNITDPENDSVSVRFFWENEDTTDWSEYQESGHEFEMFHAWPDSGTYHIRVQTKDIWETKGEWNKTFTILISDSNDVGICFNPLIPQKTELFQNYPNPFNPVTTIRFDIPETADIRLTIYDVNGRQVRTLVDGKRKAGVYAAIWNGKDSIGRPVSAGVYIFTLKYQDVILSKKMIFLK